MNTQFFKPRLTPSQKARRKLTSLIKPDTIIVLDNSKIHVKEMVKDMFEHMVYRVLVETKEEANRSKFTTQILTKDTLELYLMSNTLKNITSEEDLVIYEYRK